MRRVSTAILYTVLRLEAVEEDLFLLPLLHNWPLLLPPLLYHQLKLYKLIQMRLDIYIYIHISRQRERERAELEGCSQEDDEEGFS